MSIRIPQLPKWIITLILATLTATLAAIFSGPLKDFIITTFNWFVSHALQQNPLLWVIFGIAVIVILVILQDRAVKSHALNTTKALVQLDNFVFRMLPIYLTATSDGRKRILKGVLRQIITVFGKSVECAAILLPDKVVNPSSLTCREHYHMPEERIQATQCSNIGTDVQMQRNNGGFAGVSFLTKQILVAHLENGKWVCKDGTQHINSDETHPSNPYLSFVNVPIMKSNPGTDPPTCIGILHLESRSKDTFDAIDSKDSNGINILLEELATRVAALIEGF